MPQNEFICHDCHKGFSRGQDEQQVKGCSRHWVSRGEIPLLERTRIQGANPNSAMSMSLPPVSL